MPQATKPPVLLKAHTATIVPGPQRFCLSKISRAPNTRWVFAVRYFDDQGRKQVEIYSADTEVEIKNRRIHVISEIRCKGMTFCDCGCDFTQELPIG